MKRNMIFICSGVVCIMAGVGVLGSLGHFYWRSHEVSSQLLTDVGHTASTGSTMAHVVDTHPSQPAGLIGEIQIPSLSLKAPIVEGTGDGQLDVAVGHLTTSVQPGQDGTSVLAAHNATWFRHIDRLTPGDIFEVQTSTGDLTFKVSKAKIVRTGDEILNTARPSVVLESCYPLDALYLTPYRYLVYAGLISSETDRANRDVGLNTSNSSYSNSSISGAEASNIGPSISSVSRLIVSDLPASVSYQTSIPNEIREQGITLATNALPMGSLRYTGSPSNNFIQSNSPLNATSAIVQLFLAWVHASSSRDSGALATLLPMDADVRQNPLYGVPIEKISYLSGFQVTLNVNGTTLRSVLSQVDIRTPSSVLNVKVQVKVNGDQMSLKAVSVGSPHS